MSILTVTMPLLVKHIAQVMYVAERSLLCPSQKSLFLLARPSIKNEERKNESKPLVSNTGSGVPDSPYPTADPLAPLLSPISFPPSRK